MLLGESTHGTEEFYRVREAVTKRLIEERGFTAVLFEADWPAMQAIELQAKAFSQVTCANTGRIETLHGVEHGRDGIWCVAKFEQSLLHHRPVRNVAAIVDGIDQVCGNVVLGRGQARQIRLPSEMFAQAGLAMQVRLTVLVPGFVGFARAVRRAVVDIGPFCVDG